MGQMGHQCLKFGIQAVCIEIHEAHLYAVAQGQKKNVCINYPEPTTLNGVICCIFKSVFNDNRWCMGQLCF